MDKYDIFISYSRKDTAIADKICKALDKYGITYFIDRRGIAGGMEFPMVLADAIIDSRLFLFLASRNSYDSKFTNSEITFAFNEKSRQSILPYIIDGSELPRHFRFIFSGINWRNIDQHPIEPVLIDDLCALLDRKKAPVAEPQKKSAPTQNQIEEWAERGDKYDSEGNYTEAAKWYRLAAEQGNAKAQCNLALMYENGLGVERNHLEAIKWYKLATEQGLAVAQFNLGNMYYYGKGVDEDYGESVKWYKLAAEQGYANAQCMLGIMYDNGNGVKKDLVEAIKWSKLAAEQGLAVAQFNLGIMYMYGEGVKSNPVEAVKWFRLAAEQGLADAQFYLGLMYYNGEGVESDPVEAVKWFRLAAEQGHAYAQFNLGLMYENGEGVKSNPVEAVKWYRLAAEQGDADAVEALKRLNAY